MHFEVLRRVRSLLVLPRINVGSVGPFSADVVQRYIYRIRLERKYSVVLLLTAEGAEFINAESRASDFEYIADPSEAILVSVTG
jgi:hypothetical protein